jgi:nucleoid-associated protein YgaU
MARRRAKRAGGGVAMVQRHFANTAPVTPTLNRMGIRMGIFRQTHPKTNSTKSKFSGATSGSASTAAPPQQSAPAPGAYTVLEGDTLSQIAQTHYGDPGEWRRIYAANQDTLRDPDLIFPGQSLRIPTLSK